MQFKSDFHIYLDLNNGSINEILNYKEENKLDLVVTSPPCTQESEPDKSFFAYKTQHFMAKTGFGIFLISQITSLFYNKDEELRKLFRLFIKSQLPYKKVLTPNNNISQLFFDGIKFWLWINPKIPASVNELSRIQQDSIFGLKLHASWHKLKLIDIQSILSKYQSFKPIYLILPYDKREAQKILNFLILNDKYTFIIGYGGFPHTTMVCKTIDTATNLYVDVASFHISKSNLKKLLKVNKQKLLYATDWPYNFKQDGKFSPGKFDSRIASLGINPNDLKLNYIKELDR